MDQSRSLALVLLIVGGVLVAVAVVILVGGLSFCGRLPGDIRIRGGRTEIFIPITSMLLLSLVLTLVVNLIRRLF